MVLKVAFSPFEVFHPWASNMIRGKLFSFLTDAFWHSYRQSLLLVLMYESLICFFKNYAKGVLI